MRPISRKDLQLIKRLVNIGGMKEKAPHVKKPGRPSGTDVGDTRERLLDAATRLFSEQGVAGTSMTEIAAAVGVTSAMIHYYFKTRDHLLDAVVVERITRAIVGVQKQIRSSGTEPLDIVQELTEKIIAMAIQNAWFPPLWIREIASDGGQLRERLLKNMPFDMHQRLCEAIVDGQRRGTLNPDINPYLFFVSIIGQTLFPLAISKIWRRFPTLGTLNDQQLVNHATSLLLYGLAGQRPERKVKKNHE